MADGGDPNAPPTTKKVGKAANAGGERATMSWAPVPARWGARDPHEDRRLTSLGARTSRAVTHAARRPPHAHPSITSLGRAALNPRDPQWWLAGSVHPYAPFVGNPLKWESNVYDDGTRCAAARRRPPPPRPFPLFVVGDFLRRL
jgi:hypothetical protein